MVWLEQLLSLQTQASPFALCAQTPRSTLNGPAPPPLLCLSQSSGEKLGNEGKYDSKRNVHAFDKQNRQLQGRKNRLTSSTSFHKRCGGGGQGAREPGKQYRTIERYCPEYRTIERYPHLQLHQKSPYTLSSHLPQQHKDDEPYS